MPYQWWEAHPEIYAQELEACSKLGVTFERVEHKGGFLRWVGVRVPGADGEGDVFTVVFPVTYPYFRPNVFRESGDRLSHHESPDGAMCLLPPETGAWSTHETAAQLLCSQLPKTLAAGRAQDIAELPDGIEVEQAEPIGAYLHYSYGVAKVAADTYGTQDLRQGQLRLLAGARRPLSTRTDTRTPWPSGTFVDAEITAVVPDGVLTPENDHFHGRWVVLENPSADAATAWAQAEAADLHPVPEFAIHVGNESFPCRARLVLFEEENAWRSTDQTKLGSALLLAVRNPTKEMSRLKRSGNPAKAARAEAEEWHHWIKVARYDLEHLRERAPSLHPLRTKKVLVCGYGAIGSVVVDQLARAGLKEITVLDSDTIETGNIVRHTETLRTVGHPKAIAAALSISERNPHTTPGSIVTHLGVARWPETELPLNEMDLLVDAVANCDLLIDATAENGVARFLSTLARQADKPYLRLTATEGAYGGSVLLLEPGNDQPCWTCSRHYLRDNPETAVPPRDNENGTVQPRGCILPTFTGTHFDLAEVSLQAVRTAVSVLCRSEAGGYLSPSPRLAILRLRNERNEPTLPVWHSHEFGVHTSCTGHSG